MFFCQKSLKVIGSNAFNNCISLKSITIPSNVTEIYDGAFANCTALSDVTLSKNLEYIDDSTFYNCISLMDIDIPESVSRIGNNAFYGCNSLTDITIPSSVKSIEQYAFSSCGFLENINILDGVSTIGSSAFWCCHSLKSITIPNSVSSIGSTAFGFCDTRELTLHCHENSYAHKFAIKEKIRVETFEEFEREQKEKKKAEKERERIKTEEEKAERERIEKFFASTGDSVANHFIDAFINYLKLGILKDCKCSVFGGANKAQWHKEWLDKTMTFPNVVVADSTSVQLDGKEYFTVDNNGQSRSHHFDYDSIPINLSYVLKIFSKDKEEVEHIADTIKNHFKEERLIVVNDLMYTEENNIIRLKVDEKNIETVKEVQDGGMSAYTVSIPFLKYLNVYHFADRSADDIPNNHALQLKLLQQLEYYLYAYNVLTVFAIKQLERDYIEMVSPSFSIFGKWLKPYNPNLEKLTSDYKKRRPIDKTLFDQTFILITTYYPFLYNRMLNRWNVEQIKDDILKYADYFKKRRDRIIELLKLPKVVTSVVGGEYSGRDHKAIEYYINNMYTDELVDINIVVDWYAGKPKKRGSQGSHTTKEEQRKIVQQRASVQSPRYESDDYDDDMAYEIRKLERELSDMKAEQRTMEREMESDRRRQESQSTRKRAPDLMGSPGCIIGKPMRPGSGIHYTSCNFACPLWQECCRGSFKNR